MCFSLFAKGPAVGKLACLCRILPPSGYGIGRRSLLSLHRGSMPQYEPASHLSPFQGRQCGIGIRTCDVVGSMVRRKQWPMAV